MTSAVVGYMPMPAGFAHADVFRRGRPRHGMPGRLSTYDAFYRKHPPMDAGRRAKIFAPFDALKGFSERVLAKEVLYEEKRVLTEGEKEELDHRIGILHEMTKTSRLAQENRVQVTITHFIPCREAENDAFGKRGTYENTSGILQKIDLVWKQVVLDREEISADNIVEIQIG